MLDERSRVATMAEHLFSKKKPDVLRSIESERRMFTKVKKIIVLSSAHHCCVTLTHSYGDPLTWVVEHSTKLMWFKKLISTDWFNNEQQALAFARNIEQECGNKKVSQYGRKD